MAGRISARADAPQDAPVFIIGMPRTGTTLVDRILSSHPMLESAGELQAMPLAVKAMAGTGGRHVLDPETALAAAQGDMAGLGRDYLARAAHHRRAAAPRFIDKFPGNFHYVGFIARARRRRGSCACGGIRWIRCWPISAISSPFPRAIMITATICWISPPITPGLTG
jgi:hypothetical protein